MKKKAVKKKIEVVFLVDQSGNFGDIKVGQSVSINQIDAENLISRGIAKLKTGAKNGK